MLNYIARENERSQILVTNFSRRPVTLTKNMMVEMGRDLSEQINAYDELTPFSKPEVNPIHYKESAYQ